MQRRLIVCLTILCGLVIAGNAPAALYTWVDERGVTHITDAPVVQGADNAKIEKRSSEDGDYRWFGCTSLSLEEKAAAVEFLERQEGWPTRPDFKPTNRRYGDAFQSVAVYEARLPDEVIKKTRCSSGYQEVHIKTAKNLKDRTRCRIAGVELGQQRFQPSACMKQKKNP